MGRFVTRKRERKHAKRQLQLLPADLEEVMDPVTKRISVRPKEAYRLFRIDDRLTDTTVHPEQANHAELLPTHVKPDDATTALSPESVPADVLDIDFDDTEDNIRFDEELQELTDNNCSQLLLKAEEYPRDFVVDDSELKESIPPCLRPVIRSLRAARKPGETKKVLKGVNGCLFSIHIKRDDSFEVLRLGTKEEREQKRLQRPTPATSNSSKARRRRRQRQLKALNGNAATHNC